MEQKLRSLGIEPKRTNELNDENELKALFDNLKLTPFQDYKTAYSDDRPSKSSSPFWSQMEIKTPAIPRNPLFTASKLISLRRRKIGYIGYIGIGGAHAACGVYFGIAYGVRKSRK